MPGHVVYWETPIAILGKLYSNTMMIVLNNRIVFKTQDESTISNEPRLIVSNPGISLGPHGGISVTREEWTIPLDVSNTNKETEANSNNVHAVSRV